MTIHTPAATNKKTCERCGDCCRNGGPALHTQDRALLESGVLTRERLVTIRRGEAALHPLSAQPRAVEHEFLKISGRRGDWACVFYDPQASACTIHDNQPLACKLLECRAPQAALEMIGRDLLTRLDCIGENDPLLPLVRLQEEQCPCPDLNETARLLESPETRPQTLARLTEAARRDLALRDAALRIRNLPVELELFYFGRPLFHLLAPLGIEAVDSPEGIVLRYREG